MRSSCSPCTLISPFTSSCDDCSSPVSLAALASLSLTSCCRPLMHSSLFFISCCRLLMRSSCSPCTLISPTTPSCDDCSSPVSLAALASLFLTSCCRPLTSSCDDCNASSLSLTSFSSSAMRPLVLLCTTKHMLVSRISSTSSKLMSSTLCPQLSCTSAPLGTLRPSTNIPFLEVSLRTGGAPLASRVSMQWLLEIRWSS